MNAIRIGERKNNGGNTMAFLGLIKKTDPVCGMKQEQGKGMDKNGKWFCSENCLKVHEKAKHKSEKAAKGSCCH